MKLSAKATIYGCYLGYITQAIVNNLPPLPVSYTHLTLPTICSV